MLRGPGIRRTIILILEICVWRQIAFEHVENFYADTCLRYEIISNSGMVADVIVQRIKTVGFGLKKNFPCYSKTEESTWHNRSI